jgi:uracil-DNA glycosylase
MSISSLDNVKNQVVTCTKCDLCKTRKNSVPGKGDHNSKIIFVGEAPGRNEDNTGEPFVGAAGKKLSEALEYAGISRDSVYITNVVKCRPPNNRVPTLTEKESCRNYLESEIKLIKPKVICIMGNTAYQSILGGKNITKERGKFVKKNGKRYFLTVHPAALIYNQKLMETLKNDMKTLVDEIKKM